MLSQLKNSGVFWMIVSVLLFSFMQVFVRMTSNEISVYQQVVIRNLIGIFVAGYFIQKEHLSWFGAREEQPFLFGRSLAGFLGLVFFFAASREAAIADVTIVNRTGPFFTTLLSVVFLKEKALPAQWCALIIVFIGGLIAANPSFDSSFLPMLLALLSAVANGVAYTLLAHFKGKVPVMTVMMHLSVFSVLAGIPFLIHRFQIPSAYDLFMLLMIGILGNCGQIAITLAYRLAPATEIAIYDQLSVVASILLGWIFLNQTPNPSTLLGGGTVICASLWIYFYMKRRHLRQEVA